jgi:hypothetical protein
MTAGRAAHRGAAQVHSSGRQCRALLRPQAAVACKHARRPSSCGRTALATRHAAGGFCVRACGTVGALELHRRWPAAPDQAPRLHVTAPSTDAGAGGELAPAPPACGPLSSSTVKGRVGDWRPCAVPGAPVTPIHGHLGSSAAPAAGRPARWRLAGAGCDDGLPGAPPAAVLRARALLTFVGVHHVGVVHGRVLAALLGPPILASGDTGHRARSLPCYYAGEAAGSAGTPHCLHKHAAWSGGWHELGAPRLWWRCCTRAPPLHASPRGVTNAVTRLVTHTHLGGNRASFPCSGGGAQSMVLPWGMCAGAQAVRTRPCHGSRVRGAECGPKAWRGLCTALRRAVQRSSVMDDARVRGRDRQGVGSSTLCTTRPLPRPCRHLSSSFETAHDV